MDAETNRKYSIWILILFVIGAIFTVVWGMFLDKGTVKFEARLPFEVQILGGETIQCTSFDCVKVLKPGMYTFQFQKDGYEDVSIRAEIKRWSEVQLKTDLNFIPILVDLGRKEDVSEVGGGQSTEIYLDDRKTPVILAVDKKTSQQALQIISEVGPTSITYFPRAIENARLFPSDDSKSVYVVDNGNEKSAIYKVDLSKKSREKIFESEMEIEGMRVSPDQNNMLIVQMDIDGKLSSTLLRGSERLDLDVSETWEHFSWLNNEELIILTTQSLGGFSSADDVETSLSFEEYIGTVGSLDDIVPAESAEKEEVKNLYSYSIKTNEIRYLTGLPKDAEGPFRLVRKGDFVDGKVFVTDVKKNAYQLKLSE